jgi:hypothetical protein
MGCDGFHTSQSELATLCNIPVREVRECLESLGEMLAMADAFNGRPAQDKCFDLSRLSDEELHHADILEKAYIHADRKP